MYVAAVVSPAPGGPDGVAAASVRRYPAALQRGREDHLADAHLAVDHADPDPRWARTADLLLVPEGRLSADGGLGAAATAFEEDRAGCRLLLPGGRSGLRARWQRRPDWAGFAVAASVAYAVACASAPAAGLRIEVTAGPAQPTGLLLVEPL